MSRIPMGRSRQNHASVLVLVRGGRDDQIDRSYMPLLSGIKERGTAASLAPTPGPGSRVALYTGLQPDVSGRFAPFAYNPEASPFRWVQGAWPLSRWNRPGSRLARRFVRYVTRQFHRHPDPDPLGIPPRFMPFFSPQGWNVPPTAPNVYSVPSLFDVCRMQGLRCWWSSSNGDDTQVFLRLVRSLRDAEPYDLFVVEVEGPARSARSHGLEGDGSTKRALRRLDESLGSVHAALSTSYGSWDMMVCSDSPMSHVQRRVDISRVARRTGLRPVEDYVLFVSATTSMLWYRSKIARDVLEGELAGLKGISLVDDEAREALRIPRSREWGDRLVAAEPGTMFWPSFDASSGPRDQAASGYLRRGGASGFAMLVSGNGDVPETDLEHGSIVDVFPTVCALLGVRAPEGQGGRRYLKTRKDLPLARRSREEGVRATKGMVVDV